MSKIIKQFKGGSLSSTNLIKANEQLFVRKSISTIKNREYGFVRWYSQLKKQQRFQLQFPNLFPKIISIDIDENYAYFDMEYFENSINAHEYICSINSEKEIEDFFDLLITSITPLYDINIPSCKEVINLYLKEEVEQKINDCNSDIFLNFKKYQEIIFNGERITPFILKLDKYKQLFKKYYTQSVESFTHGNLTLENILFIPKHKKIILIDPYEENIIDSNLTDFSQLLQSTNSKYELFNISTIHINNCEITVKVPDNLGLNYLNKLINSYIGKHFSKEEYIVIKLFEISQFLRMLPFKMEIDQEKTLFFYALASKLFNELLYELNIEDSI